MEKMIPMRSELNLPSYFSKISTADAKELLSMYEKTVHVDSLSGFFNKLNYFNRQEKLFNKHGCVFKDKFPVADENFPLLDFELTLCNKLMWPHYGTQVGIATEDNPVPGRGENFVVSRAAYDAIMNDGVKVRNGLGANLHYSVEAIVEAGCTYAICRSMSIWNPLGRLIYEERKNG